MTGGVARPVAPGRGNGAPGPRVSEARRGWWVRVPSAGRGPDGGGDAGEEQASGEGEEEPWAGRVPEAEGVDAVGRAEG